MENISLIIIGLSLSIDAFCMSLAYGIMNLKNKIIALMSVSVGAFHFIMPLIGLYLSDKLLKIINVSSKTIFILVLFLILLETIKSFFEENKEKNINIINVILFSFLVSIDSFSLGLGIKYITNNIIKASFIFSIVTFIITYLGFKLGKIMYEKAVKMSKIFGIALLLFLIIYYLCT